MTELVYPQEDGEPIVVDLRNPHKAAFLAWLWPGAGHFYQRRFVKGFLFMICVLSTYFFGLGLGHGRVVYASIKKNDVRWQYILQLGVGAPALPAAVQMIKTKGDADPFWVLCERYGEDFTEGQEFSRITDKNRIEGYKGRIYKDGFMAPPAGPISLNNWDTLGRWHFDYKHYFELGTLFTVIAGLLNLLAIYDAFCGPAILTPAQRARMESSTKDEGI